MSTMNYSSKLDKNSDQSSGPILTAVYYLWRTNWLLTTMTGIFLLAFAAFAVMSFLDDTIITGVNAWIKPMKFAISSAFYVGTITWMIGQLTQRRRLVNAVGYGLGAVLVGEVAIVAIQAARGVTSHFNLATELDSALFAVMGSMIMALNILTLMLAVILAFEKMGNKPLAWSMRFGVLIALLAGIPGYMMVAPTADQAAALAAGAEVSIVGAHSVGVADGGPGLPFVGWSTEGGDLRPAHFIGLHALQLLPFAGLMIRRRWGHQLDLRRQSQLLGVIAASYASFMFLLIWQAERGQSIISPDFLTLSIGAIWAIVSVIGVGLVWHNQSVKSQTA